jgi:hypothetical protein
MKKFNELTIIINYLRNVYNEIDLILSSLTSNSQISTLKALYYRNTVFWFCSNITIAYRYLIINY